jgi:hypothetical protein
MEFHDRTEWNYVREFDYMSFIQYVTPDTHADRNKRTYDHKPNDFNNESKSTDTILVI